MTDNATSRIPFVDAIREDREPLVGIDLAVECIEIIYAAYLSAAEGRRGPPRAVE